MLGMWRGSPASVWSDHARVMTSFVTHLHDKYWDDVTWRMVNRIMIDDCQAMVVLLRSGKSKFRRFLSGKPGPDRARYLRSDKHASLEMFYSKQK